MSASLRYQRSKELGISDEEIAESFAKKDPSFRDRYDRSLELGKSPEEIFSLAHEYYERKKETPYEQREITPKKKEMGAGGYVADVAKQGTQGFGIGLLGTYGDILDLFGLQAKDTLPGEKAKNSRDFDILQRMQEGKRPSTGELIELSDDDVAPRFSRLASSQDIESLGKDLNLVSEPNSAASRYARRIGKIGGGGASLGVGGVGSAIAAGAAGQTLEELGAPPWAQAAAEIIAGLKAAPKTNVPLTSKSKEVEEVIQKLRKAGYTEKDITLAKSALEERKLLKKYASLTPEAENSIQKGIKNSEELFNAQIKKGLPGYAEGGLSYLEKQASNVYGAMEELASSVPVKNATPVKKSIQDAIAYLEKFPLLDEQKKFIEFMKDGLSKVDKAETADFFTGFYRNLGKAGNWGDPKQKEHLLALVKNGIKQSFAESGPEAAKFGKYFEKTNEAWKHWLGTRDLMETIEKAQNVDGMNFKKLASILNDSKNHDLAKKVLGSEQLENIKSITEGAEAIGSLLKQLPKNDKTIQSLKILEGVRALLTGDYRTLSGIIGLSAARNLSTRLLTDPSKQNLMKKLIVAAKNNSPQQAAILAQKLVKEDDTQAKEEEALRR